VKRTPPAPKTLGSICSGIGGLELGLERSWGATVLWQVEVQDYAQKVLSRHWPDAVRFADVRSVGAHNLLPVDAICAGFPCQPASQAGKRRGRSDERWLWPEVLRVVREVEPSWVVLENVQGLLTVDGGEAFEEVLRGLAESGFDATWGVLGACDVDAPHRRHRVFVVAWRPV
jgi:DNA (cytosine-5)-methyltransferase 1